MPLGGTDGFDCGKKDNHVVVTIDVLAEDFADALQRISQNASRFKYRVFARVKRQ